MIAEGSQRQPSDEQYRQAAERLKAGDLVAFPTETVYGLGADALNPAAIAKVFALKGRPIDHPLIAHIADNRQLPQLTGPLSADAKRLIEQYWPGPLTLVLPKLPSVPNELTGGQGSVGIRMPAHPVALELIRRFGNPLAAPSANRFGRISPTRAHHVREEFIDEPKLIILDGGACEVGIESTIVSLLGDPLLLRPGHIGFAELIRVLPQLRVASELEGPKASGRLESHYAPVTPTFAATTATMAAIPVANAVLAFTTKPNSHQGPWITAQTQAEVYAQHMYAWLRQLDALGAGAIWIEMPPSEPQWAAVRDRLERACRR